MMFLECQKEMYFSVRTQLFSQVTFLEKLDLKQGHTELLFHWRLEKLKSKKEK